MPLFPFQNLTILTWIPNFLRDNPAANMYVVGGAVRDAMRGATIQDIDLVVTGCPVPILEAWLATHGKVELVGKAFGVFKFIPFHDPTGQVIDIALPRTEQSVGSKGGYRDFTIQSDAMLPIEDDLARRDFTINAMAYDWRTGILLDPFGGEDDLRTHIIRTVGDPETRFTEDATRILRAIRFASTLRAAIEPTTWDAIRRLASRTTVIAADMVGREFSRALLADPVRALTLYRDSGVWNALFTDLPFPTETLDPLSRSHENNITILLAIIAATVSDFAAYRAWLVRWHINVDRRAIDKIHLLLSSDPATMPSARVEKLFLPHLETFIPTLSAIGTPLAKTWTRRLLEIHRASLTPPILTGRDLQKHGIAPGPVYARLIEEARSTQLDGKPIPHLPPPHAPAIKS